MPALKFKVTQDITAEKIRGLLCDAFEGGSNYWYMIEEAVYPKGLSNADYGEGGKGQDGESYWHWAQLLPTQEGGAVIISSKEGDEINGSKRWKLDKHAIQRGLDVMREKYPRHFGDFLAENDDADTGDVFLQCCLFGELIYG